MKRWINTLTDNDRYPEFTDQEPQERFLSELYKRLGGTLRLGLERTEQFMDYLDHPETRFRTIHIAGTNGKGSVAALVARILELCGYKTGRFTSPHLVKYNERIRINGQMIPDETLKHYLTQWQDYLAKEEISFFEVTTGLAFQYFADQAVEVAIIETGLGGRLDSTNVLNPELSVITEIDFDHTKILGETLPLIAKEKAGIIKFQRPAIVLKQCEDIMAVFQTVCEQTHSQLLPINPDDIVELISLSADHMTLRIREPGIVTDSALTGFQQLKNIALALAAVRVFFNGQLPPAEILRQALRSVDWPGRLEILRKEPLVIYDVAHNLGGVRELIRNLRVIFPGVKPYFILGILRDKQFEEIYQMLKNYGESIYLIPVESHRSFSFDELKSLLPDEPNIFPDLRTAAAQAGIHSQNVPLIILGSHYIASEVYRLF